MLPALQHTATASAVRLLSSCEPRCRRGAAAAASAAAAAAVDASSGWAAVGSGDCQQVPTMAEGRKTANAPTQQRGAPLAAAAVAAAAAPCIVAPALRVTAPVADAFWARIAGGSMPPSPRALASHVLDAWRGSTSPYPKPRPRCLSAARPPHLPPPPARRFGTSSEQPTEILKSEVLAAAEEEVAMRPTTPWVRQVISGVDLMRHPKYNKGMAFSDAERDRLYLRGLLPPAVLSQEVQLERILLNMRSKMDDLEKYTYLTNLQERNQRLFYRVMVDHFEELLPIVHRPTVPKACKYYNLMFKSVPRALFITLEDRGRVYRILKNWPEAQVQLVVLSDGERMGTVGDVGVQAIANPISKLSLYTTAAGISPQVCLPIVVDTGTDNEDLLASPFYVGVRHRRVRGDAYFELMEELMAAIHRRYGNKTLIHFEDMTIDNVDKMLSMYRSDFPCFSDEKTGTAAVILAAVLAAEPKTGKKLKDHTFLFSGSDEQSAWAAEFMAMAIAQHTGTTVLEARSQVWLVDQKGLVTRERGGSETLEGYKLPFCHEGPTSPDLLTAVKNVEPSVLVGLTMEGPPHFKFTRDVCAAMADINKSPPIVLPLSQDINQEASARDIYEWTNDRALVATDCMSTPVTASSGATHYPAMCSSIYIFPGVGKGINDSRSTKLRDTQFIAAAEAVARLVSADDLARGALLPPLSMIREVSANVAQAVAIQAYQKQDATALPKPHNLLEKIRQSMYLPHYLTYR